MRLRTITKVPNPLQRQNEICSNTDAFLFEVRSIQFIIKAKQPFNLLPLFYSSLSIKASNGLRSFILHHYFIRPMSFGTRQFEHRYFKDRPINKKMIPKIYSNNILPILSTPQPLKKMPYFEYNAISSKDPLCQAYYSRHPYAAYDEDYQDYLYNSLLIDTFKRDADFTRKTKKVPYLDSLMRRRFLTEPIAPYGTPSLVYVSNQNPEIISSLQNQNVLLASKISETQRKNSQLQSEATKQKQKVRDYRRKYEKLKNKLKEEINLHQQKQAEQRYQRQRQLMREQAKIKKIENEIEQLSNHMRDRSLLFRQNLRLREQITRNTSDRPNVFVLSTPKTALNHHFDRAALNQKQKDMLSLRRQISELERRLSHSLH